MPQHPDTGETISGPVYEAIMAERARAAELLDAEREAIAEALAAEPAPKPIAPTAEMMAGKSSKVEKLLGCLIALVLVVILVGFPVGGYFVYKAINASTRPDAVVPVVTPVTNLAAITKPIADKLAYDPAKASEVFKAYSGFAEALKTKSADRIKDTRVLAAVQSAFLTDIDSSMTTPVGKEIDQAIAAHLGLGWGSDGPGDAAGWEFKTFTDADVKKLAEILQAIADAAETAL